MENFLDFRVYYVLKSRRTLSFLLSGDTLLRQHLFTLDIGTLFLFQSLRCFGKPRVQDGDDQNPSYL